MVRSFIVLLLLAVFFLTGMLYGMDRENIAVQDEKIEKIESIDASNGEQVQNNQNQEDIVEQEMNTGSIDKEESVNLTQQTASFLEAGVKGFYEVIVEILYQVSQLFY